MFKLTPFRVLAKLCLYISLCGCPDHVYKLRRQQHFSIVLLLFFRENPPEMVRYFTLLISQCWRLNDCQVNPRVSDKDVVTFIGQLNDFMTAAYKYHKGFCDIAELKNGGLHV